jgi:hypothetical protein
MGATEWVHTENSKFNSQSVDLRALSMIKSKELCLIPAILCKATRFFRNSAISVRKAPQTWGRNQRLVYPWVTNRDRSSQHLTTYGKLTILNQSKWCFFQETAETEISSGPSKPTHLWILRVATPQPKSPYKYCARPWLKLLEQQHFGFHVNPPEVLFGFDFWNMFTTLIFTSLNSTSLSWNSHRVSSSSSSRMSSQNPICSAIQKASKL